MSLIRRMGLLVLALAPVVCGQRGLVQRQVQRKLALVIGNSAYPQAALANPLNDAAAMEVTLRRLGFEVTVVQNADLRRMRGAIDQFAAQLGPDSFGFFYFAGHGIQVNRTNYLIPVDYSATSQDDVQYEAYPAERIKDKLEGTGASLRVIVLDACRNNPWRYTRDSAEGLAPMAVNAVGTLIAYATGDNNVAADNPSDMNGLYTKYLMPALLSPGLTLHDVFQKAKDDVYQASRQRQNPTIYENLVGEYTLIPREAPSPERASPAAREEHQTPRLDAAVETWNYVRDSQNPEDFDNFAKTFPQSDLAGAATIRASQLRRGKVGASSEPAPTSANQDAASRGKQLLGRMQRALGGANKIAGIRDFIQVTNFTVLGPGGYTMKETIRFLAPSYTRGEQEKGADHRAFYSNGATGWWILSQGTIPMSPEDAKEMTVGLFRSYDFYLSDRDPSRTIRAVDDRTVEITASDGQSLRIEIDPVTGLPAKEVYLDYGQNGKLTDTTETLSDWRQVDGVSFPFKSEIEKDGARVVATMSSFRFNTGLTVEAISRQP